MEHKDFDQIIITDKLVREIEASNYKTKDVYYASEDLHTCQILKRTENGLELVEESFKFKTQTEAREWTVRRLLSFYMKNTNE